MAQSTGRRRLSNAEFLVICARDDWTCQICRELVDPALEWPHPLSRSQEHIIPWSRDGATEPSNICLTHLFCNLWKRARLDEEVVGLDLPSPHEAVAIFLRRATKSEGIRGRYGDAERLPSGEAEETWKRISKALLAHYANRDSWPPEKVAAWEFRNQMLSESMLGNRRGFGNAGRKGQPWTDAERESHLAALVRMMVGGEWQASLRKGQQRRRAAEKAGERPMFSEAGLQQSLANLAKGHAAHGKAIAKSAEVRRARVQEDANRMWAERAEKGKNGACLQCGGIDSKPIAKGLCTTCYMRQPKPATSQYLDPAPA